MTLPTCAVHCSIFDDKGLPVEGAQITARLNTFEVYQGHIVPREVDVLTGADGQATMALWPNQLGSVSSYYDVTITAPSGSTLRTTATVPDTDHANLHEITLLPPYPGKTDGQLALDAAIAAIAPASSAAIQATQAATAAAASAATAATKATEAATSATTATAKATEAATSATTATDKATEAATSATTATTKSLEAASSAHTTVVKSIAANLSASIADTKATEAATSATTATTKATEAATSATTATTKATEAASSATAAATSATTATTKAGEAATSATTAATKATEAATSATGAAASATTATTKATEAEQSATGAADSAMVALMHAREATQSAQVAQAAASSATTATTEAASSATAAATSATTATAQATNAAASSATAATRVTAATNKANEAAASAAAAAASATAAAASAAAAQAAGGVSSFNGRTGAVALGSQDIKTINGATLLGAGDLVVSGLPAGAMFFAYFPTGVTGPLPGCLNGDGSIISPATYPSLDGKLENIYAPAAPSTPIGAPSISEYLMSAGGIGADKAFIANTTGAWGANANGDWMQVKLTTARIVNHVYFGVDGASSFIVSGSNDGTVWQTLATSPLILAWSNYTLYLSNTTAYIYYRVTMSSSSPVSVFDANLYENEPARFLVLPRREYITSTTYTKYKLQVKY